jgi:hypothetical protein
MQQLCVVFIFYLGRFSSLHPPLPPPRKKSVSFIYPKQGKHDLLQPRDKLVMPNTFYVINSD